MTIFAIIVTYNAMRHSWMERCLNSLKDSTVPITPIVIDNGSKDGTGNYVMEHFPNTIWLPQDKNLGFGQANNVGLRYALKENADYVLLLNQDATIGSDAIEKMLPFCNINTLMSPIHLNGDASKLDSVFKLCLQGSKNSLLDDLLVTKSLKSTYSGPDFSTGRVIPAACWFLPMSIIKNIGGFNPLFFHYSEDDNYFQRLNYHHVNIKICPLATMSHDRGEHGNMQVFNQKRIRRMLLRSATNINISLIGCLKEWGRILLNCYLSEMPKRNYIPGQFSVGIIWIIFHLHKIAISRKKERKGGLIWL